MNYELKYLNRLPDPDEDNGGGGTPPPPPTP